MPSPHRAIRSTWFVPHRPPHQPTAESQSLLQGERRPATVARSTLLYLIFGLLSVVRENLPRCACGQSRPCLVARTGPILGLNTHPCCSDTGFLPDAVEKV